MSFLDDILDSHERDRIINNLFPYSNRHLVSNGVANALMQIEMGVANRYKSTEWCALGFEKDGIVDRIIIPNQFNSGYWFSSDVTDKNSKEKKKNIIDSIKEGKKKFGKDYALSTLFHSHHVLGVSFSGDDKKAFPGFLTYIEENRITEPIEFSSCACRNDIRLDDSLIIAPVDDNRKPILELNFNVEGLYDLIIKKTGMSGTDFDIKDMFSFLLNYKIKERLLIRDGFSSVLDRKGIFISKQGFLGESPVSGGKYIHRMRDADLEFVEIDNDFSLASGAIDDILDDKLNVPKPKKYSANNRGYLKEVYDGTPKHDLIIIDKKEKPDFNMISYEFAEQIVGYLRRSAWAEGSKYSCLVAGALNKILKNSAENLSDGFYLEYLASNDFTKDVEDGNYNMPKIPETSRHQIAEQLLKVKSKTEKDFIIEFTYASISKKDHVLERFFGNVLKEREVDR